MEKRAETLRRRLALCRRYLAEGVDTEFARKYLSEIASAEAELARLEKDSNKRE